MHKPFTTELCIKFKRFFLLKHKISIVFWWTQIGLNQEKYQKNFSFEMKFTLFRLYYILFHKAQQINFFSWHFNHVWSLTYNNKSNSHTQPKIEMSVFFGRMSYDLFELPHSTIICLLLYWIELMYFLMICCWMSGNDNQI